MNQQSININQIFSELLNSPEQSLSNGINLAENTLTTTAEGLTSGDAMPVLGEAMELLESPVDAASQHLTMVEQVERNRSMALRKGRVVLHSIEGGIQEIRDNWEVFEQRE